MKNFFFFSRTYPLRKSRRLFIEVHHLYKKKKKKLSASACTEVESALLALQADLTLKDREKAHVTAKNLEAVSHHHLKKSTLDRSLDFVLALLFALVVAVLVRQMWFEPYEIPSGSMRPTLREKDRLTVSKTTFGINIPLTPKHFYFDPALVKRSGIFIFTGENMDIADVDTLYFYLFPGKKQYVKRLIGKPGDILYFYGGQIFGIDQEGSDISLALQPKEQDLIDHVPFIQFERKISLPQSPVNGIYPSVILYQMNEPVARLFTTDRFEIKGEMLPLSRIHAMDAPDVDNYGALWGMNNFGMCRLVKKESVISSELFPAVDGKEPVLYLEIKHHPNFAGAHLIRDEWGKIRPGLGYLFSFLPLSENHLRSAFSHLTTARFIVEKEMATRWGWEQNGVKQNPFGIHLAGVPDGCYEIIDGKAYEVLWQGITKELPESHPLCQFSLERFRLLYNFGIEFDTRVAIPSRYIYFRNGALYLMGAPALLEEDVYLKRFVDRERERRGKSAFIDWGPPLTKEGSLNVDFIKQFGLKIPEETYLALGDNHAMSSDSRDFGFVPQNNLRGAPQFIFWPPGDRWGKPNQPSYPFFNLPCSIIWAIAALSISGWYWHHHKKAERIFQQLKKSND